MQIWKIEVCIGYTDQTWTTSIIEVSADTPYEKIGDTAEKEILRLHALKDQHKQIAFTKMYNRTMQIHRPLKLKKSEDDKNE